MPRIGINAPFRRWPAAMSKRPLYRITKSGREKTRAERQKAKRRRKGRRWEDVARVREERVADGSGG